MISISVFVLFLVSITSALPPPTLPASVLSPCNCSDGTQLNIGDPDHRVSDCTSCRCTLEGIQEIAQACARPPCVDSYSVEGDGVCCPICPNGSNCMVIDDVTGIPGPIPDGETIDVGHAICRCDVNNFDSSTLLPIAECVFPPPPPTTCKCRDGTIIGSGETHHMSDCAFCYCDYNLNAQDVIGCCFPFNECVDYIDVEGDGVCCPTCPNGRNCKADVGGNTTIIPYGQSINFNGAVCRCDFNTDRYEFIPLALCVFSLDPPVPGFNETSNSK